MKNKISVTYAVTFKKGNEFIRIGCSAECESENFVNDFNKLYTKLKHEVEQKKESHPF